LRREKTFQSPDAPQFFDLFRDPRFETAIEFRYLIGALVQFADQPRILHGDDRLGRKVFEQRNLLVGEGLISLRQEEIMPSSTPSLRSGR
jgi:hypothetical protein